MNKGHGKHEYLSFYCCGLRRHDGAYESCGLLLEHILYQPEHSMRTNLVLLDY